MRHLAALLQWLLGAVFFVLCFFFALHNRQPVDITVFINYTLTIPLVVALLGAVASGLLLGLVLALFWRSRRTPAPPELRHSTLTPPTPDGN